MTAQGDPDLPSKNAERAVQLVRDYAVSPLLTGFFQGFFTVAHSYYKERRAARKMATAEAAAFASAAESSSKEHLSANIEEQTR